ncbi:hypothetical protein NLU13_6675 [Sarocladium strictum]|uniref:Zn(2)-C6 fungal-type domain-containing protein n=1 Tax=Sarocladium strictum TaxID=5046 RepID=A0AA39GDT4_SARSR|nr:hypothetical protein NLU13_6675 [Sarocladium strictum]
MAKPKNSRREPRPRTFTGCGTCRSRHLKCDEKTPTCSTCSRLNLVCQGYTPRLLWLQSRSLEEGSADRIDEGNSFRYPLFTEEQRSSMSLDMVQSLGGQSAGQILSTLDNEPVSGCLPRGVGPFTVFKALESPSVLQSEQIQPGDTGLQSSEVEVNNVRVGNGDDEDGEEIEGHGVIEVPLQDSQSETGFQWSSSSDSFSFQLPYQSSETTRKDGTCTEDWMTLDVGWDLPWSDISAKFSPGAFSMRLRTPRSASPVGIPFADGSAQRQTQPFGQDAEHMVVGSRGLSPPPVAVPYDQRFLSECRQVVSSPRGLTPGGSSLTLPLHAADLLAYLKTEVFENPTLLKRGLSPWKTLLMPCAFETVAEISLWNKTSYARRSVLSTLLAHSALYLSKSKLAVGEEQEAAFWLKVGADHRLEAQRHLKTALRTELAGDLRYEEMLMAILGVSVVSFHYSGAQGMKLLLLDAERLIRWRGIPAQKTFRHRVLHHFYTHLRLMVETTNISSISTEADAGSGSDSTHQQIQFVRPRRFGIQASNLGDLDMNREKPESVGYNDIHLDVSGTWHGTLYPEMYGVPEALMTLLSQTISLVNEKPRLEASALNDPEVAAGLSSHVKTLEQQIWSWSLPCGPKEATSSPARRESAVHDQQLLENVALAMHQAIIIFFYRRVYKTSIMIVQDQVKKTLDYVQPFLDNISPDSDFSVSIGWSVFIAACDAATAELQDLGLSCLKAVDDYGMFIEEGKLSTMTKKVWEERQKRKDLSFGWPDLMMLDQSAV